MQKYSFEPYILKGYKNGISINKLAIITGLTDQKVLKILKEKQQINKQ